MASRGVAILPEGMSQERFDWLEQWCENPADDVIRTVGTESNVKEIYDACNELAKDSGNVIFNQFCEFGNHLAPLRGHRAGARPRLRDGRRRSPGLAPGRVHVGDRARRARSRPATA